MAKKRKKKIPGEDLQKLSAELQKRVQSAMNSFSVSNANDSTEFLDIASDNEADEMQARIAEAASHQIEQINNVMEKIRDGTYGRCEECGEQIAAERLKAIPFATKCIKCKELEERELGYKQPPKRSNVFSQSIQGTDDDEAAQIFFEEDEEIID